MRPFIEVRGLEHVYSLEGGGQVVALRGVDLTVDRGEFVALVGPNGSGKSTLARHLNGLRLPPGRAAGAGDGGAGLPGGAGTAPGYTSCTWGARTWRRRWSSWPWGWRRWGWSG